MRLSLADLENARNDRAESSSDLHRGPFTTTSTAGPQREERGERFHPNDTSTDDSVPMMKGLDHCIAATTSRLWDQPGQKATGEPSKSR